jgi:gliding motility-associated-like protein
LTGGASDESCGGVTAYGPGADFAIWINGLEQLNLAPSDYFLTGLEPLSVTTLPNGDIVISGIVYNGADPEYQLQIDVLLDNRRNWLDWSSGGGLAKDPLGTGNFPDWGFLLLNGLGSNITGVVGTPTEGWSMTLAHNPGSEIFGFQVGSGANTHNLNDGLGGWFSWSMSVGGEDYASVGDLIVDLTACTTGEWDACQGDDLVYEFVISNSCGTDTSIVVVQITDSEAPEFLNCENTVAITCVESLPPFDPEVVDNCSSVSLLVDTTFIAGNCGANGTWIRTYTAVDSCGNAAVCEVETIVEDLENLTFVNLPAGGAVACSDWAECETFPLPVAVSGCAADSAEVTCDLVYMECDSMPSIFDAVLIYSATDDCGFSIVDSVFVNVVDNEPPYFTWVPPSETMTLEEFLNYTVVLPVCVDDCFVPDLDCVSGWDGGGGGLYPLPCDYDSTLTPLCCGGFEILYHFFHVDLAGNEASVDVTITVIDDSPPEFVNFPPDTLVGCSSLDFLDVDGNGITLTDNSCPQDSLFLSHNDSIVAGACDGEFTLLRTFTAVDNCGNTQDSLWTVTVVDTTAPLFISPLEPLFLFCGDSIPLDSTEVFDACGSVTLSDTLIALEVSGEDCNLVGQYEHRWFATDACGNTDSIGRVINILDPIGLHFVNPMGDATVECSDWAECETFPLPLAVSGCGGDTAEVSCEVVYLVCDSMPSVFDAVLVYTATNECGDSATHSVSVDVVDNEPPYFEWVPPSETMTLEEFENWSIELPICYDSCYVPNLDCTTGWPGFGGGNGGGGGGGGGGNGGLYPLPCDYDSTLTPLCCGGFEILYHFFHVDLAGNEASVDVTISVLDASPPEFIAFPADTLVGCSSLDFLDLEGNGISLADNSCSIDSLFLSHNDSIVAGNCGGEYTILRTFTAMDNCGNAQDSLWIVQVVDTIAPVFTSPLDTLFLACGQPIPLDSATAEDACGSVTLSDTLMAIPLEEESCNLIAAYEHWWHAADACGNVDSIARVIHVLDTIGPFFVEVPDSVSVECVDWMGCETLPLPTAISGGCASDSLFVNCAVNYLDCGVYPASFVASLVYTAENACGESIVDSTVVTVLDTSAPYFTWVPPDTTMTIEAFENWTVELPVCVDDCYYPDLACGEEMPAGGGIIACDYDSTLTPLCCGGFEILYNFYHVDLAGNEASVDVTVAVVDDLPPTFVDFPSDTIVQCGTDGVESLINDTLLLLEDNSCPVEALQLSHLDSIIEFCPGTFTLERTFVAADECGNTALAVWTVEVVDTIAPSFVTWPDDLTLGCTDSIPGYDSTAYAAMDGCSDVVVWFEGDSVALGDCPASFDIWRTVGAMDGCGNVTWHQQLIAIRDTVSPQLVITPSDTTISCEADMPLLNFNEFSAMDDCTDEGDLVYTLQNESTAGDNCISFVTKLFHVEDGCGNFTQFSQLITLVDTTGPVFAETLEPDSFLCGDLVPSCLDASILWDDNCNGASWSCSDSVLTGDCTLNECLIERTFVLTDACGNETSATQLLTVSETAIDAQLPTGISPNGDLINDEYFILNIDPELGVLPCAWGESNEIVIFNRWGNEVYRELNYRNTWAGTNQNGEPLPEGTYFVVFTLDGKQYSTYIDLRR